jgi:riboflavin kinase / FMN adenylyltransferase
MKFVGTVIHGDAHGRTLGYPTANIVGCEEILRDLNPEIGVYAGFVQIQDYETIQRAGIVISELNGDIKLEAHLLDFKGDLYGRTLTVEVGKFIRPYKQFDTEAELINSIAVDVETVRQALL